MEAGMDQTYDVVVVGARCAGSPTAMLLAQRGYRVGVVDRAEFPSDTISTHLLHPPAVDALRRWGLLDRLVATGCPPISTYTFDFGPIVIAGSPGNPDSPTAYCPRRTVLDKLLVDGAREAGAEVRERFSVTDLVVEDGVVRGVRGHGPDGVEQILRARFVVGADGVHSRVAELVGAETYRQVPPQLAPYYSYFSGLDLDRAFPTWIRGDYGWAAIPTHDDLTLVVGGWPMAEMTQNRDDVDGTFRRIFALAPDFFERFNAATRETRWTGFPVPNYFRTSYGPGWVLVGDAGYTKDPITAHGIKDSFRDAEACAAALDAVLSGARTFDEVMADYQDERDAAGLPMFEFTLQVASPGPPPPEMLALLGAVAGNPDDCAAFTRMWAGVLPVPEFFAPENVGRIMAGSSV
jgi:2-polyprenyl-6-methoxyphenol hydroxylase-like FAD-dependent oxidoreductase